MLNNNLEKKAYFPTNFSKMNLPQNHNSEKKSQYESFKNRFMNESKIEKKSYLSYHPNKPQNLKEDLLDESRLTKFGFESEIQEKNEDLSSKFDIRAVQSNYKKSIISKKEENDTDSNYEENEQDRQKRLPSLVLKIKERAEIEQILNTLKQKVEKEMNIIFNEMNLINEKHKNILPTVVLENEQYSELQQIQERNLCILLNFIKYLKNLNMLKEQYSMVEEDYLSKEQQKLELISQMTNIDNAIEKSVINFKQNENSSQIIEKNIEIKHELQSLENNTILLFDGLKDKEQQIFSLQREMFEKMKKTNDIFTKNREVMSRNISFKKDFLENLNFEEFNCSQKNLFQLFEAIGTYDSIQFDKKIKNLKFDLNNNSLQQINHEFIESIDQILVDFYNKNFIEERNKKKISFFKKQILNFVKESNFLFKENILTFEECTKTKILIVNLNFEYEELKKKYQILEENINLYKKEIKNYEGLKKEENIDFNYLSESGRFDYFSKFQDSLSELELKKKINEIKYQEALSSIEIFGNQSETLKKKISRIEKKKKNLSTEKEQVKKILIECLAIKKKYINEVINILIQEDTSIEEFLTKFLNNKDFENFHEKTEEILSNNLLINRNFIEFLEYLNHKNTDIFVESFKTQEIIKLKQIHQNQNPNDKKIFKEELNFLKTKLKSLNEKDIPELNQLNEYHQVLNDQIYSLENKNKEQIDFVQQNFSVNKNYIEPELLKKIWITFREHYDLTLENIKKNLEEGFVIDQKANFNKSFDILKFLEIVELKKMRVSLEKFGFAKKLVQFNFDSNEVKILDIKKGSVQVYGLNDFKCIQFSEFTIKMIKAKMPIFYKKSQLDLYSQKIIKLFVDTKISELFIKEKKIETSFILKDFFIFLCLIFSTQLNLIIEFENHF